MPDISMPQRQTITDSINDWLEKLLSSSKNIEILAESSLGVIGNGDEDLRIREMAPLEEASLEKYTKITEGIMTLKRYLTVSLQNFYLLLCIFRFSQNLFFYFFFGFCSSFCFIIKRFLYSSPASTRP